MRTLRIGRQLGVLNLSDIQRRWVAFGTPLGITGMYGGISEGTKSRSRLVAKSCRLPGDPLLRKRCHVAGTAAVYDIPTLFCWGMHGGVGA